jgi:hypothetical protein
MIFVTIEPAEPPVEPVNQSASHLTGLVFETMLRRRPWWCRRPPTGIPLSGRVPERAPGSSQSRDGSSLQYVSWKRDLSFRSFLSRGTYRRKGIVRGGASWPHHGAARPGAGPCPPVVSLAPGPPPSHLRSSWSFGKNRRFGFCFVQFWEYFLCNFSKTEKQQKTGNWHCSILLIG